MTLRRSHSLEFGQSPEAASEPQEPELDIHAAAQLLESFDVEEFLGDVSLSTPRMSALNAELSDTMALLKASRNPVKEIANPLANTEKEPSATGSDDSKKGSKGPSKSRKELIIELRASVEQLTERLEELKAAPFEASIVPANSNSDAVERPCPPLWKHAAMRQFERRRKAEEDNVQLREMLAMQVQEAKCLQRLLKRRTKIQLMEEMLGMKRRRTSRFDSAPEDTSSIFKKMLQDTDIAYAEVDKHFMEKGVQVLPCPGQRRKVKRSVVSGVFFEQTQRDLLPFSMRKTVKAAWMTLTELGTTGVKRIKDFDKLVEFHAQHSEESRDTIATSYFSAIPGSDQVSGAQVRKVMRMHVEEDKAVFIWKMLAEPKLKGSNASLGFQLQSTLQVVIRPGESTSVSGDDLTEVWMHFSAVRRDLGLPNSAKARAPGHLDTGIALYEKLLARIRDEVESVLIDDACGAVSLETTRQVDV